MKTSHEIRYINLLDLIASHGGENGGAANLARVVGINPSIIGNIKNKVVTKSGTTRNVGDDLARKIEESVNMPYGWMDNDHSNSSKAGFVRPDVNKIANTLQSLKYTLTNDDILTIINYIKVRACKIVDTDMINEKLLKKIEEDAREEYCIMEQAGKHVTQTEVYEMIRAIYESEVDRRLNDEDNKEIKRMIYDIKSA